MSAVVLSMFVAEPSVQLTLTLPTATSVFGPPPLRIIGQYAPSLSYTGTYTPAISKAGVGDV